MRTESRLSAREIWHDRGDSRECHGLTPVDRTTRRQNTCKSVPTIECARPRLRRHIADRNTWSIAGTVISQDIGDGCASGHR